MPALGIPSWAISHAWSLVFACTHLPTGTPHLAGRPFCCWLLLTRCSQTKIVMAKTWHFEIMSKNNGSDVTNHCLLCALCSAGDPGDRAKDVILASSSIQSSWGPDNRKRMALAKEETPPATPCWQDRSPGLQAVHL